MCGVFGEVWPAAATVATAAAAASCAIAGRAIAVAVSSRDLSESCAEGTRNCVR